MRSLACILLLFPIGLLAQVPTATLDTAVMRIGEQLNVLLSVDLGHEGITSIEWPLVEDELGPNMEVIRISEIDTIHTAIGTSMDIVHLERRVVITSFDTGFWAIAPFRFEIGGQVMETAPLLLEVRGIDLGEKAQLRDIKPIHEVPFSLLSWLRRNWYWIVLPLLLVGALWYAWKWWRRRPIVSKEVKETGPTLPIHERILIALREVEQEKLWQNGAPKPYYSRITELLREYIEERYHVPALERTTDDLLHELRVSALGREQLQLLHNMLQLSDMVKFAKAVPTPLENEQIMHGAIRLVQETTEHRATVHDHA